MSVFYNIDLHLKFWKLWYFQRRSVSLWEGNIVTFDRCDENIYILLVFHQIHYCRPVVKYYWSTYIKILIFLFVSEVNMHLIATCSEQQGEESVCLHGNRSNKRFDSCESVRKHMCVDVFPPLGWVGVTCTLILWIKCSNYMVHELQIWNSNSWFSGRVPVFLLFLPLFPYNWKSPSYPYLFSSSPTFFHILMELHSAPTFQFMNEFMPPSWCQIITKVLQCVRLSPWSHHNKNEHIQSSNWP